jgi:hypothetical protein
MPKLICKGVIFYSQTDETSFFEWISRIKGIDRWEGIGDEVHLHLPKKKISDECLRDLTALLYRYKIEMSQLQQFVNEKNSEWYAAPGKYWHKKVFKQTKTPHQCEE